jgi:hypothetical protein
VSDIPLLVGFTPDDAEARAAADGITIRWVDAAPPRWLPPHHAPRVLRQRVLSATELELLRGEVPVVADEE